MDDILVHKNTREEHEEQLREGRQYLIGLGTALNSEKYKFALQKSLRTDLLSQAMGSSIHHRYTKENAKEFQFRHANSSPFYSQGIGEVVRTVVT